jgi:leader peptidase (prepilin peptidase)/N-methyltransferase
MASLPVFIFFVLFFFLGLIIGSFLNVVIYRLNTSKSLGGRSACMSCRSKLGFFELIPVFSFLVLGGRCKSCRTKISMQYPLVELVSGIVFALIYFKFQNVLAVSVPIFSITFIYYAFMFSVLLVIATYDLKHKIIPDQLSLLFGLLSFVGLFFFNSSGFLPHTPTTSEFLSGVFIALPFALLWLVSSGAWMGFGDAKLAIGLGWFVGIARAMSGLMLAFWTGAIVGILLMFSKAKYGMKSEIPFAPFLVFGMLIAFIFELHLFPL